MNDINYNPGTSIVDLPPLHPSHMHNNEVMIDKPLTEQQKKRGLHLLEALRKKHNIGSNKKKQMLKITTH